MPALQFKILNPTNTIPCMNNIGTVHDSHILITNISLHVQLIRIEDKEATK